MRGLYERTCPHHGTQMAAQYLKNWYIQKIICEKVHISELVHSRLPTFAAQLVKVLEIFECICRSVRQGPQVRGEPQNAKRFYVALWSNIKQTPLFLK